MGIAHAFAALVLLVAVGVAYADGGAVVARKSAGSVDVTVFVSPVPLRAGPADVSVLVQETGEERPVLDAQVSLRFSRSGDPGFGARADHDQATNRLLYAAQIEIPAPGTWRLGVDVERGAERVGFEVPLAAAPARTPARRFWPWLVMPVLVVAVFLLHQWLRFGADS